MTAISVKKPYSLKTATVTFTAAGETGSPFDFSDHISGITFTPSSSAGTFTAVNSKVISDISPSTWEVALNLVQDLDIDGFLRWLLENEGKKYTLNATFANGTDPCKIVVTARAASLGGSADGQLAVSSVTLPADGKPDFTTAG